MLLGILNLKKVIFKEKDATWRLDYSGLFMLTVAKQTSFAFCYADSFQSA